MKKNLMLTVLIGFLVGLIIFSGLAYAADTAAVAPQKMSVSEMIMTALTSFIMYIAYWLKPKIQNVFARSDEEAEKRIKLIENQRIAARLQDGRAGLRKAVEAALCDFYAGLEAERKKDGIINQDEAMEVAKKAVDGFLKAESNSTGDLMQGLGVDLYECAAQEIKELASKIFRRFR